MNVTQEGKLCELLDKQQIYEVIARLVSAIDRNDQAGIIGAYTTNAIDEHGEFSGTARQFAEWVDGLFRERIESMSHIISNQRVKIIGEHARAETYVSVYMKVRPFEGQNSYVIGVGRYLDSLKKTDGEWLITHRQVLSDHLITLPQPAQTGADLIKDVRRGSLGLSDPVYSHMAEIESAVSR